jgi:hypothetical protein
MAQMVIPSFKASASRRLALYFVLIGAGAVLADNLEEM